MKKVLITIYLLLLGFLTYAQNISADSIEYRYIDIPVSKPPYFLDHNMIDPLQKTVSGYANVGDGHGGEGGGYFVRKDINFNTTRLVIFGDNILFKEYFPSNLEGNLDNLKIIRCEEGYVIFRANDSLYFYNIYIKKITRENISGFKAITDSVYLDKKGSYHIIYESEEGIGFEKLAGSITFDSKTLRHILGNYYYDKNGLYFLEKKYRADLEIEPLEADKLENSEGSIIKPFVSQNYFIYNGNTYADNRYQPEQLPLDISKRIEIEVNGYYSLTDGRNYYEKQDDDDEHYSKTVEPYHDRVKLSVDYFYNNNIKLLGVIPFMFYSAEKGADTLYLPLDNPRLLVPDYSQSKGVSVLLTSDGYYFVDDFRDPPKKIKQILIYNTSTKKDEILDLTKFRYLNEDAIVYRDRLFVNNYRMQPSVDAANLKYIRNGSSITNYITDGKLLIYIGYAGESPAEIKGQRICFVNNTFKNVDLKKLRAISKDRLTDGKYLYNGLNIIPIKAMGLDVRIFPEK